MQPATGSIEALCCELLGATYLFALASSTPALQAAPNPKVRPRSQQLLLLLSVIPKHPTAASAAASHRHRRDTPVAPRRWPSYRLHSSFSTRAAPPRDAHERRLRRRLPLPSIAESLARVDLGLERCRPSSQDFSSPGAARELPSSSQPPAHPSLSYRGRICQPWVAVNRRVAEVTRHPPADASFCGLVIMLTLASRTIPRWPLRARPRRQRAGSRRRPAAVSGKCAYRPALSHYPSESDHVPARRDGLLLGRTTPGLEHSSLFRKYRPPKERESHLCRNH